MAVDGYKICPYGTGKKLKFCCKDGAADFEKLQKFAGAGQWAVLLQQTELLDQKTPGRPCVLAEKCHAEMASSKLEAALKTAHDLIRLHPQNPSGYALRAECVTALGDNPWQAIDDLQTAQELDGPAPCGLIDPVMMNVAAYLVHIGLAVPGAMHLQQLSRRGDMGEVARRQFIEFCREEAIPPAARQPLATLEAPDEVEWEDEYAAAEDQFLLGSWRESLRLAGALAAKFPDEPAIVWLQALSQAALGDLHAHEAFARVSASPKADLKLALLAEMLRRSTERVSESNSYGVKSWNWPIRDGEALRTALLSDRHWLARPVNPAVWTERDETPPELAGVLLDRAAVPGETPNAFEDLPTPLGNFFLYGKRTDKEAMLTIVGAETADLTAFVAALQAKHGALLGAVEEKVDPANRLLKRIHATRCDRIIDPQLDPTKVRDFLAAGMRKQYVEIWAKQPWPELDGKSPADVKDDPRQRRVVWGLILGQWLFDDEFAQAYSFAEFLDVIGFPAPTAEDLTGFDAERPGLVELCLLDPAAMSTETIAKAWVMADSLSLNALAWRLGNAFAARETEKFSEQEEQIFSMVCATLARLNTGRDDAAYKKFLTLGRGLKRSVIAPWQWDLLEIRGAIMSGDQVGGGDHLNRFAGKYQRDQRAMQGLMGMLQQMGIQVRGPEGSPAAAQGAAAPAPSKLWTGGAAPAPSAPAAAPPPEKKSALWVPGD